MQEQSFTLYAQWAPERRTWMIADDADLRPLILAESVEELMAAVKHCQSAGDGPLSPGRGLESPPR